MYRYGEFEAVLTSLHRIPPNSHATLRARIKYYRRLKMFGDVKGDRNVVYTFEDLVLWAFMLEIAQFGIDPQRMVQIASVIWPLCRNAILDQNAHTEEDLFFAAKPVVLSSSIMEDDKKLDYRVSGLVPIDAARSRFTFLASELRARLPERGILVNVSELHRRVDSAVEYFGIGSADVRPQD